MQHFMNKKFGFIAPAGGGAYVFHYRQRQWTPVGEGGDFRQNLLGNNCLKTYLAQQAASIWFPVLTTSVDHPSLPSLRISRKGMEMKPLVEAVRAVGRRTITTNHHEMSNRGLTTCGFQECSRLFESSK